MTSSEHLGARQLLLLLITLELSAAALYETFARRFAARGELKLLWGELARDERHHARLLEEMLILVARGIEVQEWPRMDSKRVDALIDEISAQLERAEREEISADEALAFTISLETSELVECANDFMTTLSRRYPGLPLLESTSAHVKRLIAAVDRLVEPEITTLLKRVVMNAPRTAGGPRKILICDDEADMVESCARICRRSGHICLTATDASEALALFERERPDLLITDLRMPDRSGLEVLRQAKQIAPHVPVVVITAYVSEASAHEALQAGATAYLPKPFTAYQLRQTVDSALGL